VRLISALLLCVFALRVQAETATTPTYDKERIPFWSMVTEIPHTTVATVENAFTMDTLPGWATILGTTAVLYHYDPDLYQGIQNDGRRWNIGSDDDSKTLIKCCGIDIFRAPSDTGATLYFLGDGWVHAGAGIIFLADGYFTENVRPWNTGIEILHGLGVATIFDQTLKRAFGRQSPGVATADRGEFRPFPSIPSYQRNTSSYDAMPSGHIMTATLAFTVVDSNYPEYLPYLYPLEGVWLAALGFEMVNNGVHWASDYPLGIGIGYFVGKMSLHMNERPKKDADGNVTPKKNEWVFFPSPGPDGPMMNAMLNF